MDKRNFAFDKVNFMLLAVGMAIVIIGFILMSGSGSSETVFNPDIFSVRRIKVAPMVCLFGFLFIIYAILRKLHIRRWKKRMRVPGKRKTKCPVRTPQSIRIKHGCIDALLMGLLQGLTEYLPVSSSGHLAIASHFFGIEGEANLTFTVAVHVATVFSTLVILWKDIVWIFKGLFDFKGPGMNESQRYA